jgi:hypothetical protein
MRGQDITQVDDLAIFMVFIDPDGTRSELVRLFHQRTP